MRVLTAFLLALASVIVVPAPDPETSLQIYAIDVEGGKATLVVAPSKESLLIDTGNIGEGARRDADRILAALHDAAVEQIDHLATTHWHRDHMGAMPLLAATTPIMEFIDHGANVQPDEQIDTFLEAAYGQLYANAKHTIARPGDTIAIAGLDVRVVASAGQVLKASPDAGGANPYCPELNPPTIPGNENTQSIGLTISFGRFRVVDLSDLTTDKEFALMCPHNTLGMADVFMVSHHGQLNSNSEAFVHAIEPRVAIMNNGVRKGGEPEVMKVIFSAAGLEDLWQLHASRLGGQEYTAPGLFIANETRTPAMHVAPSVVPRVAPPGSPDLHTGPAHWIKVSAMPDGSFTVTNSRNGFSKTYRARAGTTRH